MNSKAARQARRFGLGLALVALCTSSLVSTSAFAYNRWVKLVNDTDYTLVRFFASNQDDPDWGRDRLGTRVIWPGFSMSRLIDDGSGYCLYDFKAVFEDGDELTEYGVNVCDIYEFRYF